MTFAYRVRLSVVLVQTAQFKITPPIMIDADETEIAHVLDPIGEVSVNFTWD